MHNNHVLDGVNKDAKLHSRDEYLKMSEGWTDDFGPLLFSQYSSGARILTVVRDDQIAVGSKGRFGDLLVSRAKEDTIVYVAPRTGYAGISLAYLGRKHGKRVVLFAPASAQPSKHQIAAMELGAELRFIRIAAMPVLNKYAREWAERHGYLFAPFGLDHPLVTAAIVRVCQNHLDCGLAPPDELWTAVSTGVLTRGLQIGFPKAKIHGVAVARNLKSGEAGRAKISSSSLPFNRPYRAYGPLAEEVLRDVPHIDTYDAKVFEFLGWSNLKPGKITWWWNVASEPEVSGKVHRLKSDVGWGDMSATKRK